jgi:hypothetical protein
MGVLGSGAHTRRYNVGVRIVGRTVQTGKMLREQIMSGSTRRYEVAGIIT